MQGHIYDYKPGAYSGTDEFEATTTMLINYCSSNMPESSAIRYCLTELQMKTFTKPTMATSVPAISTDTSPTSNRQDEAEFKELFREWRSSTKRLEESLCKAFAIAIGQTTDALKSKIQESSQWDAVKSNADCIGLLIIIKKIAHNTEDQKDPDLSVIEATQRIYLLRQQEHQSPEAYKLQFDNMMDVITALNGCIYQPPLLNTASQRQYQLPYHQLSADQKKDAVHLADEKARATLFIQNSNNKNFAQLKNKLYNDHVQGHTDSYPANMNAAYQMLKQYRSIRISDGTIVPNEGNSFAQTKHKSKPDHESGPDELHPKWKKYICPLCGKPGHPPYPEHCKVAKALSKDPTLRDKILQNKSADSDSSSHKSKSSRTPKTKKSSKLHKSSKTEPSKSFEKAIANLQKTQDKQATMLTQLVRSMSSSSSSSTEEDSPDNHNSFFQGAPAHYRRSGRKHRSAQNSRSAPTFYTNQPWSPPVSSDSSAHIESPPKSSGRSPSPSSSAQREFSWVEVVKRARNGHNTRIPVFEM